MTLSGLPAEIPSGYRPFAIPAFETMNKLGVQPLRAGTSGHRQYRWVTDWR